MDPMAQTPLMHRHPYWSAENGDAEKPNEMSEKIDGKQFGQHLRQMQKIKLGYWRIDKLDRDNHGTDSRRNICGKQHLAFSCVVKRCSTKHFTAPNIASF